MYLFPKDFDYGIVFFSKISFNIASPLLDGVYLDFNKHVWLHQPWGSHEEGRVCHSSGRRDDLTSSPVDGLTGNGGVQDLELRVANRLLAQWALPGGIRCG